MRALLLAVFLLVFLPLTACDPAGPEIVPEGLKGTWENINAQESITYRTTNNGYRFERSRDGSVVTHGAFATSYDPATGQTEFRITYTVFTDESSETEMRDDSAELADDVLVLTATGSGTASRTYRRAD